MKYTDSMNIKKDLPFVKFVSLYKYAVQMHQVENSFCKLFILKD